MVSRPLNEPLSVPLCICHQNKSRKRLILRWISPHNTPLPFNSSSETFIIAAHELAHALKNPEPQAPFSNIDDSQMVAIEQLSEIFSKVADNLQRRADPPQQQNWKIRPFTSESVSRYDQTSFLSTSQYHRRWWGDVLYKFSSQGPHVPFRSKHYSPWSPCPTTNSADWATSKGGHGRAKFQFKIKRQENSHSIFCIDSTIPENSWSQFSDPSNLWNGPGIQTSGLSPRQKILGNILCKWTGTISPGYHNCKSDKYSHFNYQITSPKR